jgi:hypothetical protein
MNPWFSSSNLRRYSNQKVVPRGLILIGTENNLDWGTQYEWILGWFLFANDLEKALKLFDMILWGHEQASKVSHPSSQISAGYHTHLNLIRQDIGPL